MSRIDLSKWIIHFIHRRNPENDPLEMFIDFETGRSILQPDSYTFEGKPLYKTEYYEEEYSSLAPDEYAFGVLKKVLHDGYIRAGWSYRKNKPTIYGPKAAVCFTEMPLYGLIDYAKSRNSPFFIEDYGIAFLKEELFSAGARPVIYGLSTKHEEANKTDPYYGIGLRTLSSKCGLNLKEQYRYVATNLDQQKRIDWMHEREWRWADLDNKFERPGMPFYLNNDQIKFSKIVIIVKEDDEKEDLIDYLKRLYNAETDMFDREYNISIIQNTYVLSLESISKITSNISTIRLEDLPFSKLEKIKEVKVDPKVLQKVEDVCNTAKKLAYEEAKKFDEAHPNVPCYCGFARVVTFESHTEITQALLNLGIAVAFNDEYAIHGLNTYPSQSIDVEEKGARVAADFLTKELGQKFYVRSRLD